MFEAAILSIEKNFTSTGSGEKYSSSKDSSFMNLEEDDHVQEDLKQPLVYRFYLLHNLLTMFDDYFLP